MARRLDFWFDYSCPYAYIASTQVKSLAARMNAELVWQPMLLGGVFKANGTAQNLSEVLIAPKLAHNELDFVRWASLFDLPLQKPAAHPMRTVDALRATLATGCDPRVIEGFFRAYWVEGRVPSDPATIRDVVSAAGHDAAAVAAKIDTADVKDDLRRRTDRAIALGIFGAPAFVVDEKEMYWGQDRMHFAAGTAADDVLPPIRRRDRAGEPPPHLDFYWDFSSPFAYLGSLQVDALVARTGATVTWRPMLLGGLFKTIGQSMVPLATWSEAKQKYIGNDIHRWAAHHDAPFRWPSHFPTNSLKAMRIYMALEEAHRAPFRAATFRAFWADDRDIADDAVLRDLIASAGADVTRTEERMSAPDVKKSLVDATQHAADAGVFGAPTFIVNGKDLFWGQDRIPLVERALVG